MNREYQFTLSRTDRIYLISFVLILLSWELIKFFIPHTRLSEFHERTRTLLKHEIEPSNDKIKRISSIAKKSIGLKSERNQLAETRKPVDDAKPVNIMGATLDELESIGFDQKVAYNITKYADAGGTIKNKKDVLKIYGMDSTQWNKVSPYVLFPKKEEATTAENTYIPNRFLPKRILDLNTVSEIDLDSLPGIGPVLADRIIKYRNSLGGFHSVDQIKSCYGIPPETIDKILPFITIIEPLKPQNVNDINWKTFRHPSLERKYNRMIIAYKNNHGPFKSLEEFRRVFPPDTSWCDPLLPYITFGTEN